MMKTETNKHLMNLTLCEIENKYRVSADLVVSEH